MATGRKMPKTLGTYREYRVNIAINVPNGPDGTIVKANPKDNSVEALHDRETDSVDPKNVAKNVGHEAILTLRERNLARR